MIIFFYFYTILLYFVARGNISQQSSGLLVALLEQAQKLEPQSGSPVVVLETSKKYSNLPYYNHINENNLIFSHISVHV